MLDVQLNDIIFYSMDWHNAIQIEMLFLCSTCYVIMSLSQLMILEWHRTKVTLVTWVFHYQNSYSWLTPDRRHFCYLIMFDALCNRIDRCDTFCQYFRFDLLAPEEDLTHVDLWFRRYVLHVKSQSCRLIIQIQIKFQFFYSDSYIDNSVTRARFTLLATCR